MKRVIILATGWQPNYWESDKEAPYPNTEYTDLPEWEQLSKLCPLAGLGVYIKLRGRDFSANAFVYLRINGMRYDTNTKQPFFDFKKIQKSATPSKNLTNRLPSENKTLFSAIDVNRLIDILKEINETPPQEWLDLIEPSKLVVNWRDYIGKYYLEIESGNLTNEEFEDRVAALLTALGFNITQKGHKIPGEYPDGVAAFENYGVVYDCKNTAGFSPTTEATRAIEKYLMDEKEMRKEANVFCAFIAKSFKVEPQKDIFYFSIDALLYLLYKKLSLGSAFSLAPFKKILKNKVNLTIKIIDKEWLNS